MANILFADSMSGNEGVNAANQFLFWNSLGSSAQGQPFNRGAFHRNGGPGYRLGTANNGTWRTRDFGSLSKLVQGFNIAAGPTAYASLSAICDIRDTSTNPSFRLQRDVDGSVVVFDGPTNTEFGRSPAGVLPLDNTHRHVQWEQDAAAGGRAKVWVEGVLVIDEPVPTTRTINTGLLFLARAAGADANTADRVRFDSYYAADGDVLAGRKNIIIDSMAGALTSTGVTNATLNGTGPGWAGNTSSTNGVTFADTLLLGVALVNFDESDPDNTILAGQDYIWVGAVARAVKAATSSTNRDLTLKLPGLFPALSNMVSINVTSTQATLPRGINRWNIEPDTTLTPISGSAIRTEDVLIECSAGAIGSVSLHGVTLMAMRAEEFPPPAARRPRFCILG